MRLLYSAFVVPNPAHKAEVCSVQSWRLWLEGKRVCLGFNLDLQMLGECLLESPRQSVQQLPDRSVETLPEKQQTSESASLVLTFVGDIYYLFFSIHNVILDKHVSLLVMHTLKEPVCIHVCRL